MSTKPTKVTIIDVNLGADIRSIISDDLSNITAKNQADIDAAIEESRKLNRVKESRNQVTQALTNKIEAAYEAISTADARDETIAAAELLKLVQPEITSMNSLVQRLRAVLKSKGDERKLSNMRSGGATYYYLAEPDEE